MVVGGFEAACSHLGTPGERNEALAPSLWLRQRREQLQGRGLLTPASGFSRVVHGVCMVSLWPCGQRMWVCSAGVFLFGDRKQGKC